MSARTPVTVRISDSIGALSAEAWNALVRPEHPPVVRWEWLHALESSGSTVARTGWEPCHFTAWRGERLVGLSPAFLKHHSMGEYVYDFAWAALAERVGVAYYPKLLVGVPLSPLTCPRYLAAAGEDVDEIRSALLQAQLHFAAKEKLSSVHVIFPPEAEAKALEGLGLFRRAGLQYHWKNQGYRTYADFLARFDAKRRHQLKRERGAAATQGVHLRTVRGAELDATHARLAYRLYDATVSKNGWGQRQLTQGFFELAFQALEDHVELVVAEKSGQVIAGAFNLASSTRLWGRYWGCFEELPFLHFHVCLYHSIDECIALGRQVFEPGAGGEHKIPRGFPPTLIHSAHRVLHPGLSGALERACAKERAEAQGLASDGERLAGMRPIPIGH